MQVVTGDSLKKRYFIFIVSIFVFSCAVNQYEPTSTFKLEKPIGSPPIFLSVLLTDEEFQSPAIAMTGLQKSDVASKIIHNWELPDKIKSSNRRLQAIVELTVSRYGKILNFTVAERSENIPFNQSVSMAIKKSEPYPIFPLQVKEDELLIKLLFSNSK